MSDENRGSGGPADGAQARPLKGQPEERTYVKSDVSPSPWVRRAVLVLALAAMGYLSYRIALAFFPRWWAQRVADQVGGDFTSGTLWGLFYGFLFTIVPLLIIAQLRRRFFNWTWRGIVLVIAVLLATPNWLTLSIVIGNSNAAHAGERILDVDAPGFRAATAIGVSVAVVLALVLLVTGLLAQRRRAQVKDLRGKLRDHDREKPQEPGDSQAPAGER